MNKRVMTMVVVGALAASVDAGAQQPTAPPRPAPAAPARVVPPAPPVPPAPVGPASNPRAAVPPAVAPPPAPPAEPGAQLTNIRVDLVLVDEGGPASIRKNVSLTLADRSRGSVRAMGRAPGRPGAAFDEEAPFNVDVYTRVEKDGRIRTNIVLEYRARSGADDKVFAPTLKGVFEPLLDSGKKMVVWQAADPISDRHVSVEVTATVLK